VEQAHGRRASDRSALRGAARRDRSTQAAEHALLAANAGASYISPFVGRLDDVSTSGM
jgi:translation elongation factor EF-Tu-like GTPase